MSGIIVSDLTTFALILMRMTGLIYLNPIFGRSNLPRMYRAGFILALTILVYIYSGQHVPDIASLPEYVLLMMKEFILGFSMGLLVNMFVYVVLLAGEAIDLQLGLTMSAVYDPGSNISMSAMGTLYNIMFIMMFFTTNSHLTMLKLFINSTGVVPLGSVSLASGYTDHIVDVFCQCTILGMKMAIPVIFMELMVEFAVGAMMRAVPQIDVFTMNIQMKMMLGLLFVFITFQPMGEFLDTVLTKMFDSIEVAFAIAGGG